MIFAADHPQLADAAKAAAAIFTALQITDYEERESSHWFEGRYFRAFDKGVEIKVSRGDTDHSDRPIGIFISGPNSEKIQLAGLCVERLKPMGFRISQLHHWGRQDESRVEL